MPADLLRFFSISWPGQVNMVRVLYDIYRHLLQARLMSLLRGSDLSSAVQPVTFDVCDKVNTTQAVCLIIGLMSRQMLGRQPEASRMAAA